MSTRLTSIVIGVGLLVVAACMTCSEAAPDAPHVIMSGIDRVSVGSIENHQVVVTNVGKITASGVRVICLKRRLMDSAQSSQTFQLGTMQPGESRTVVLASFGSGDFRSSVAGAVDNDFMRACPTLSASLEYDGPGQAIRGGVPGALLARGGRGATSPSAGASFSSGGTGSSHFATSCRTVDRVLLGVDASNGSLMCEDRRNIIASYRLARKDILVVTEDKLPGDLARLKAGCRLKLVTASGAGGELVTALLLPTSNAAFDHQLPQRNRAVTMATNPERGTISVRDHLGKRFDFVNCQRVCVFGPDGQVGGIEWLKVGQMVDIVWTEMGDKSLRALHVRIR